jgi:ribulose-phosphate 3-epimerase
MIKISPSILAADFSTLGEEVRRVESAGADLLHIDVMDGHFVPNISLGPPVIRSLRRVSKLPFDVHLMIERPSRLIDNFIEAGADLITFHIEAEPEPGRLIEHLLHAGIRPSLSVSPGTPVQALFPYLDRLAMVLIMTVEPGFGGQRMIEGCLDKARALRSELARRGISLDIQADGGINDQTVSKVARSGVNVLVAGNAIFRAENPVRKMEQLRSDAMKAAAAVMQ